MKKPRTKATKQNLTYTFTPYELIVLGKELAEGQLNLRKLEDDRKAKISSEKNHVNSVANKVGSGYEYRNIDCTVTYDDPVAGDKTIRRDDTGELVKVMPMDESEKQEELPLE